MAVVTPGKSELLKIESSDGAQGARILKLKGQLTLQTLSEFQAVVRQDTAKALILDMAAVPYMDSAGLGAIISQFAACQRGSRGFAIIGVTDRIRTLFEITHVDSLLPCFSSLEAAETAVNKA